MLITNRARIALKKLDICPDCGANWKELEKSLNEGIASDDCYLALLLIRNCKLCMARFEAEYNRLKGGN